MTIDEARRVGDLNIDISEVEILKWRRKVRDAVREYDMSINQPASVVNADRPWPTYEPIKP
jgi:hypothetical protein